MDAWKKSSTHTLKLRDRQKKNNNNENKIMIIKNMSSQNQFISCSSAHSLKC